VAENDTAAFRALSTILALPRFYLVRSGRGRRAERRLALQLSRPFSLSLPQSNRPTSDLDPTTRKVQRAVTLVEYGFLSRANQSLSQEGLHVPTPEVVEKLRALHPSSNTVPPTLPSPSPATLKFDSKALAKLVHKRALKGKAAGPSGWTESLISPLMADADLKENVTFLLEDIGTGA